MESKPYWIEIRDGWTDVYGPGIVPRNRYSNAQEVMIRTGDNKKSQTTLGQAVCDQMNLAWNECLKRQILHEQIIEDVCQNDKPNR